MKNFLSVMCIAAFCFWAVSCNSNSAKQGAFFSDSRPESTAKTFVMRASWRPGVSLSAPSKSAAPKRNEIQFGRAIEVQAAPNAEKTDNISAACLGCHYNTYSELAKQTTKYVDKWGENVNPHLYVDANAENPHHAGKVVPSCLSCHAQHAMPTPQTPVVLPKSLPYCYSCHHEETFESCSACH